jgi:hypothetical protein
MSPCASGLPLPMGSNSCSFILDEHLVQGLRIAHCILYALHSLHCRPLARSQDLPSLHLAQTTRCSDSGAAKSWRRQAMWLAPWPSRPHVSQVKTLLGLRQSDMQSLVSRGRDVDLCALIVAVRARRNSVVVSAKKEMMMWEALREAIDEEMEADPTVCVMGEIARLWSQSLQHCRQNSHTLAMPCVSSVCAPSGHKSMLLNCPACPRSTLHVACRR